jgi:fatty-acyl-CoA synthase
MAYVKRRENDACGMCYTSGTTGLPREFYTHRSTLFACLTLYRPMLELQQSRYPLLIVPQFHVMAWGLYLCLLSGSNMVLPSSNLQPEAIKILQEENN